MGLVPVRRRGGSHHQSIYPVRDACLRLAGAATAGVGALVPEGLGLCEAIARGRGVPGRLCEPWRGDAPSRPLGAHAWTVVAHAHQTPQRVSAIADIPV